MRRVINATIENIEAIRRKFTREWLLIEVVEQDDTTIPTMGRLMYHTPSKSEAYHLLLSSKQHLYIIYSDDIPANFEDMF
ncbi:hypothetical protein FJZ31_32700 [Candidatus Poribacteria bacterium]|nr:hypothetical protein [Candidatus Poribacteria bacterium]